MTIVRGQQVMVFPTRFMLVAASNPCPCGLGGTRCTCTQADLARHRRRLSGPLLDRVDILMRVERPPSEALRRQAAPSSATVRERVVAARERQEHRLADEPEICNAQLTSRQIRELGNITPSALRLLSELYDRHSLSARGHTRILRVARTVADLEGVRRGRPRAREHRREPPPRRPPTSSRRRHEGRCRGAPRAARRATAAIWSRRGPSGAARLLGLAAPVRRHRTAVEAQP